MDGYGKRVLVMNDDNAVRNTLTVLLFREGYNVYAVSDGQAALIEMKRRHFDVVITDFSMQRLDGMEFFSVSRIVWPDTPVILISGGHLDRSATPVQGGAHACVHEPYGPSMLLKIALNAAHMPQDRRARKFSSPSVG